MTLDLTPLNNAVARLEEGLEIYARDPAQTIVRDGLIQRFEFTYEVAHKMLRRALQAMSATPGQYDGVAFADLIRAGSRQGLLASDWAAWRDYRVMRGKTSHGYDERIALEVVQGIPAFLQDAVFLRDQLQAQKL